MEYNRDYFIFGKPIETKFGKVRFLTYEEYLTHLPQLSLISMNSLHIFYYYKKILKNSTDEDLKTLEELKNTSLYEIVLSTPQFLQVYVGVFNMLIEFNDGFEMTHLFDNQDDFMEMRNLIMDMNVLTEEEVNPNEEIQRAIERSRRVKQQDAEKQSFIDIVTSIVAGTPHSYEDVYKMNVMQVYALYGRLGAFFNYQTTTLFATVAEKVKIDAWNRHIDLFEKESQAITYEKFKRTTGSIFND